MEHTRREFLYSAGTGLVAYVLAGCTGLRELRERPLTEKPRTFRRNINDEGEDYQTLTGIVLGKYKNTTRREGAKKHADSVRLIPLVQNGLYDAIIFQDTNKDGKLTLNKDYIFPDLPAGVDENTALSAVKSENEIPRIRLRRQEIPDRILEKLIITE